MHSVRILVHQSGSSGRGRLLGADRFPRLSRDESHLVVSLRLVARRDAAVRRAAFHVHYIAHSKRAILSHQSLPELMRSLNNRPIAFRHVREAAILVIFFGTRSGAGHGFLEWNTEGKELQSTGSRNGSRASMTGSNCLSFLEVDTEEPKQVCGPIRLKS